MKHLNKINWPKVLLIVIVVLNLIDLITAKRILPGEGNPIFLFTGSYGVMIGAKFIAMGAIIYWYSTIFTKDKFKHTAAFIFCLYMIYFMLGLSYGIYTNVSATDAEIAEIDILMTELEENEEYERIAEIKANTTKAYVGIVTSLMLLPSILGILAFSIYRNACRRYKKNE